MSGAPVNQRPAEACLRRAAALRAWLDNAERLVVFFGSRSNARKRVLPRRELAPCVFGSAWPFS